MGFLEDAWNDLAEAVRGGIRDLADAARETVVRLIRNSFRAVDELPADLAKIIQTTPAGEVPVLPFRLDTEPLLIRPLCHLGSDEIDDHGFAPGKIGDVDVRIRIPIQALRTFSLISESKEKLVARDPEIDAIDVRDFQLGHFMSSTESCDRCHATIGQIQAGFRCPLPRTKRA